MYDLQDIRFKVKLIELMIYVLDLNMPADLNFQGINVIGFMKKYQKCFDTSAAVFILNRQNSPKS